MGISDQQTANRLKSGTLPNIISYIEFKLYLPMNDKIKVLMPCEIPNLEKYVDIALIESELETYIKTLAPKINLQDLEDWNLLVNVLFQRTDKIGVVKRLARYPSDKEYAIYMSIPIPDDEQAAYGLSCVKEAYPKISNPKYSYDFLPEFSNYDDLYSYILESSRKAIDLAFSYGFTCKGKKILKQE